MRGEITPILLWTLAALPLLAVFKLPKKAFLAMTAFVGVASVSAWVAFAVYGYRFSENLTTSLKGHIYVYKVGEPFKKGDLVAYRWHGGMEYPRGATFIKIVAGVPGDEVVRNDRSFSVAGKYIGEAKPKAKSGVVLEAAPGGIIPEGEYFLMTPSVDSLDSRYAVSGNIKQLQIVGKAHEIF